MRNNENRERDEGIFEAYQRLSFPMRLRKFLVGAGLAGLAFVGLWVLSPLVIGRIFGPHQERARVAGETLMATGTLPSGWRMNVLQKERIEELTWKHGEPEEVYISSVSGSLAPSHRVVWGISKRRGIWYREEAQFITSASQSLLVYGFSPVGKEEMEQRLKEVDERAAAEGKTRPDLNLVGKQ